MARPKKAKEFTHPHRVYLRLSDLEYEIVSDYAQQANLTIAEFCRQQIVGKKVVVKYEIVADVPELKKQS